MLSGVNAQRSELKPFIHLILHIFPSEVKSVYATFSEVTEISPKKCSYWLKFSDPNEN
jgi:hypothetical protein